MKKHSFLKLLPFLLVALTACAAAWYYDAFVNWNPATFPFALAALVLAFLALAASAVWPGPAKTGRKLLMLSGWLAAFLAVGVGVLFVINNGVYDGDGGAKPAMQAALPLLAVLTFLLLVRPFMALSRRGKLALGIPALALTVLLGYYFMPNFGGHKKAGAMEYTFSRGELSVAYDPESVSLRAEHDGTPWDWLPGACFVELANGRKLSFARAKCDSELVETDEQVGVCSRYHDFTGKFGKKYPFELTTFVAIDGDGTMHYEIEGEGDAPGDIAEIRWPAAFDYRADAGGTVLPVQQGVLIPAKWDKNVHVGDGRIFSPEAYLPIFGQYGAGDGYCAVFDTPYDARYDLRHKPGSATRVQPVWRASLGQMGYKRVLLYTFQSDCDYNAMARHYRDYLEQRGKLVTLQEKIERNPAVARLLGAPLVEYGIATHISPESDFYSPGEPEKNDSYTSFAACAERLREIRASGVEGAYVRVVGWGKHGYDNLHPSPFPPHEAAGGAAGMAELSRVCRELGYIFGVWDNYRDYYYDAPGFTLDNAVQNADGSHYFDSHWHGGRQTALCATFAPEYVRRNYDEFERLGIIVQASFIDVFSSFPLDECFNPAHLMTREQCAKARLACFTELNARGIITSSEEATGSMLTELAMADRTPFAVRDGAAKGVPIPLASLVYHDCVVIPWHLDARERGQIPDSTTGFLYALLTAGSVYMDGDPEQSRAALELQSRLAFTAMLRYEFLDGTYKRVRSTFADGTTVTVNFDAGTWEIS